jgi:hypothetical protein
MHKHQYTPPRHLFMEFQRDKDRRSPAQAQVTEMGGMIPVGLRTRGGQGNVPTESSLREYFASAGTAKRTQNAMLRAFNYLP